MEEPTSRTTIRQSGLLRDMVKRGEERERPKDKDTRSSTTTKVLNKKEGVEEFPSGWSGEERGGGGGEREEKREREMRWSCFKQNHLQLQEVEWEKKKKVWQIFPRRVNSVYNMPHFLLTRGASPTESILIRHAPTVVILRGEKKVSSRQRPQAVFKSKTHHHFSLCLLYQYTVSPHTTHTSLCLNMCDITSVGWASETPLGHTEYVDLPSLFFFFFSPFLFSFSSPLLRLFVCFFPSLLLPSCVYFD